MKPSRGTPHRFLAWLAAFVFVLICPQPRAENLFAGSELLSGGNATAPRPDCAGRTGVQSCRSSLDLRDAPSEDSPARPSTASQHPWKAASASKQVAQECTSDLGNFDLHTGEQYDPDLGLYYLRSRYYDASTGRFWSMDSWEGDDEKPLTLNKYLYTEGNPINMIDPSGHMGVVSVSMGASIGNSLQGSYNSGVESTGDTMRNTIVAASAGANATQIVIANIVGQTGGLLLPAGAQKILMAPRLAKKLRKVPGSAWGRGTKISGKWIKQGRVGAVPREVATGLRGKSFNRFSDFQKAFWLEVAKHPKYLNQFNRRNRTEIQAGRAPFAPLPQHTSNVRSGMKYNLHHRKPIEHGGAVYDVDNLAIVSPFHHTAAFH